MRSSLLAALTPLLLLTAPAIGESPWCFESEVRVEFFTGRDLDEVLLSLAPRHPRLVFSRTSGETFSVAGLPRELMAVREDLITVESSLREPGQELTEFLPVRSGRCTDLQDLLAKLVPEARYSGDATGIKITATERLFDA